MLRSKRIWLASLWLLAFGVLCAVATPARAQDPDHIVYHDNYNTLDRPRNLYRSPDIGTIGTYLDIPAGEPIEGENLVSEIDV